MKTTNRKSVVAAILDLSIAFKGKREILMEDLLAKVCGEGDFERHVVLDALNRLIKEGGFKVKNSINGKIVRLRHSPYGVGGIPPIVRSINSVHGQSL